MSATTKALALAAKIESRANEIARRIEGDVAANCVGCPELRAVAAKIVAMQMGYERKAR